MSDTTFIHFIFIFENDEDPDQCSLTFYVSETKTAEFANSVGLDEVAHDEPPYLDLHCLPSSLRIFSMI